ncbi:MAG: hypothetical protein PHX43_08385, partial [Alphaproteobacteria bacterium]|nr:hypothetical protein [Alphaproteobacteria bacterium]
MQKVHTPFSVNLVCVAKPTIILATIIMLSASFFFKEAQAAQKSIGTNCNSDNSATDWDTIAQCNGTTFQKAPLILGATTTPAYASTACDAAKAGMIQWTGTSFKGCDGASWSGLGGGALGASATNTSPARADDITTGLFSSTASTVSVATAGVSRLTVTASGSVGIGTTSPGYGLSVYAGGNNGVQAQFGSNTFLSNYLTGAYLSNATFDSSGIWTARATGATAIGMVADGFHFYADSGLTSGSTFSPTQRMLLDTSGNLTVNGTALVGALKVGGQSFIVGGRSTADLNTLLTSGMYGLNGTPTNSPVNYGSLITANNIDTTLQIAGGYQSDNLYFRGSWSSGGGFSPWRTVLHSGNYTSYSPSLTGSGASGTWGISITGSSPLLANLGTYVWSASTLPTGYNLGIQTSFVSGAQSFPSYGSLVNVNSYSGGGGALQLYVPYSPTYGGTGLQVRFGNYDVSSGNSWTAWKTLVASDNVGSYALPISGGTITGNLTVNGNLS